MRLPDIFIFFSTFMVGVMAGSFIYFTGFRDIDIDPVNPRLINEFEIAVSQYGGCQLTGSCASYRLLSDGSFVFLLGSRVTPIEGNIGRERLGTVKEALADANLRRQSAEVEPKQCDSWVDGMDIAYDIVLEGDRYQLDTCGTAVDVDDELIEQLDALFTVLGNQN